MNNILVAAVFGLVLATAVPSRAITFGPFGPNGEGGTKNGQTMTIGPGGTVFELDGFLDIDGMDLNGAQFGVSAQLSRDALPAGLGFTFTNYLSSDLADLVLSYTFTNTTSTVFSNLYFFVLLDPEIDEATNTFFNEYGSTNGAPGLHGYDASQWQIDEPGFQDGTLLKNIFLGALNDSNAVPPSALNDVAMSLGFSLGNLNPGADATVLFQISEQGHGLGSCFLAQHDSDPASTTVITSSGVIPATASQMANPPFELLVLQGQVVNDLNTANSPANPSTIGISNVVVSLLSNAVPVMTNVTDSAGQYSFSVPPGLQPGTYSVRAVADGLTFVPVPPAVKAYFATSDPSTTTLPMPVPVLNFDFRGVNSTKIVLQGQAVQDGNTNGIASPTSNGVPNVVVTLLANSIPVMTNVTDSAGQYVFSNVPPGTYAVSATASGWIFEPAQIANFATSNPSTNTLLVSSVLNFDFRAPPPPPPQQFGNISGLVQFSLSSWNLNYATGSIRGTLSITNPATNNVSFGPPWNLGLMTSANFFYVHPAMTNLPDGVTNIDVSAAVSAQIPGGVLNPGQRVALTNAVEIYSRYRSAPASTLFEIWATQQAQPTQQ